MQAAFHPPRSGFVIGPEAKTELRSPDGGHVTPGPDHYIYIYVEDDAEVHYALKLAHLYFLNLHQTLCLNPSSPNENEKKKRKQKLLLPSESQPTSYQAECFAMESPSSSTDDGLLTPVSSFDSRHLADLVDGMDRRCAFLKAHAWAVPQPGKIYKIHNLQNRKRIALVEGGLQLVPAQSGHRESGCYWSCVEKGGWLGFRNVVSGTYLGSSHEGLRAQVTHHKAWEHFCVRHNGEGGYIILVKNTAGDELWKLGCSNDGSDFVLLRSDSKAKCDFLEWGFEEM